MTFIGYNNSFEPEDRLSPKQQIALSNFNELLIVLVDYFKSINETRTFVPTGIIKYSDVLKDQKSSFTFYGNSTIPTDFFTVNITYLPPFSDNKNIRHKARIETFTPENSNDISKLLRKFNFNEIEKSKKRKSVALDVYLLPKDDNY
jgi:hypothetical protein